MKEERIKKNDSSEENKDSDLIDLIDALKKCFDFFGTVVREEKELDEDRKEEFAQTQNSLEELIKRL